MSSLGAGPRLIGRATPSRRIITGRRDCITGLFQSGKAAMGYRSVAYEGRLARDVLLLLDDDPDVERYQEEPQPFPWHNPVTGKRASYTPDFGVTYLSGWRLCIEVRPVKLLDELTRADVREARRTAARDAGYSDFQIRTERDVNPTRLANAALVAGERSFYADEDALHTMRVVMARHGGRATIRELCASFDRGSRGYRATLGLLARGELVAEDRSRPLDDRAVVRFPTSSPDGRGA